jgi:hypothetical protein
MKFSELEDRAIRKLSDLTDRIEKQSFNVYRTQKENRQGRDKIEFFKDKGHLEENPLLDFALSQIKRTEEKIKKAKMQGLSGEEINRLKNKALQDLIVAVEKKKKDSLLAALNKTDEKRKTHEEREKNASFPETNRESVRLEKLKLQHSFTPEDQALAKINKMESSGSYDPLELLVLSSKSERAFNRAAELREKIPESMADNGGQLIGQIEKLTETKAGQIPYTVKGSNSRSSVYVADLMDDSNLSPKIEDLE